jgi:hypothetical protein
MVLARASVAIAGDNAVLYVIAQFAHGVVATNVASVVSRACLVKPKAGGEVKNVDAWFVSIYITAYIKFVLHLSFL